MPFKTPSGSRCAGLALLCVLTSTVLLVAEQSSSDGLPPRLEDYVTRHVKLSSDDRAHLGRGEPATELLEADASREVAIFGAVWVKAPVSRYVAAIKDIEQFEKGENFRVTKRISSPPRLEDFNRLTLTEKDVSDLKSCRVGSCDVKLSEEALTRIQKEIDWSKPTATADLERSIRSMAFEYVNGYLEGGNARLAVYRDAKRPTFVAQEFASMIDQMPPLTKYLPDLKRYLLGFPAVTLPNSDSFLYWQDVKFGLKPTIRISHVTIAEHPDQVTVVSKMLYASHYFWTAIELRVLVPDPARGEGFWFVCVNQSRSDGLSGFTGSVIRGRVQNEAEKGMLAALRTTKARLEKP